MLFPRDQLHISIALAVKLKFEISGCEFTQRQSTYMQPVNNQDTEMYIMLVRRLRYRMLMLMSLNNLYGNT